MSPWQSPAPCWVEARRCGCAPRFHLWQDGAYVNAADPILLEGLLAGWPGIRIERHRATLPGWIALRVAEGKEHAGNIVYDLERFKSHQIGALAKAIVAALQQTKGGLANKWITGR